MSFMATTKPSLKYTLPTRWAATAFFSALPLGYLCSLLLDDRPAHSMASFSEAAPWLCLVYLPPACPLPIGAAFGLYTLANKLQAQEDDNIAHSLRPEPRSVFGKRMVAGLHLCCPSILWLGVLVRRQADVHHSLDITTDLFINLILSLWMVNATKIITAVSWRLARFHWLFSVALMVSTSLWVRVLYRMQAETSESWEVRTQPIY